MQTECPCIKNCPVVSRLRVADAVISVGIAKYETKIFLVLCVSDCAGCQHITTRAPEALALIEMLCEAMRAFDAL